MTLYNQVKNFGGEIKFETVLRVDENKNVTTTQNAYSAKAIIIATGAAQRKLGIEDEAKYNGKGVSYCATCDGNFYKEKIVAVVGGGNTALQDALFISDLAKRVYVIHRRDIFRGEERLAEELKDKGNVEFILNSNIVKLNGKDLLESIDIKSNDNNIRNIIIQGLFIAVGQEPKNGIFCNLFDLDEKGYIKTVDEVRTKISGIYVAGDARVKELRQLTTATGDGATAAVIAIKEMS